MLFKIIRIFSALSAFSAVKIFFKTLSNLMFIMERRIL